MTLRLGALTALIASLAILLWGCSERELGRRIVPPATSPLSRSSLGYGVVSDTYAHILETRGDNTTSVGILREGAIIRAVARQPVIKNGKAQSWIYAHSNTLSGWIDETALQLYDTLAQAKTASAVLLNKNPNLP
jgi:hypothetical protein